MTLCVLGLSTLHFVFYTQLKYLTLLSHQMMKQPTNFFNIRLEKRKYISDYNVQIQRRHQSHLLLISKNNVMEYICIWRWSCDQCKVLKGPFPPTESPNSQTANTKIYVNCEAWGIHFFCHWQWNAIFLSYKKWCWKHRFLTKIFSNYNMCIFTFFEVKYFESFLCYVHSYCHVAYSSTIIWLPIMPKILGVVIMIARLVY